MSEIKKYQMALRHRTNPRYMTRDFIVPLYTGTEPDILDDSNTQRESSVYKEFPNDMPIVSPKEIQNQPYEQLQLADGGSVERLGFSNAGLVSISDFSKQQKSIGQQAFQKYLVPSQTNTKGGKDLLNALSKAGIVFSDKKGPYGERYLKNVNKNTIKNFEKNIKNIREYVEVPSTIIKNNVIVGVRWPNKDIEKEYINQIKERSKYSKNSNELQEKIKSGEILSDSQLAKKFGMNYSEVVRINSQIKKDYELERPVIGRDETRKQVDIKRKEAQLKFSDPSFEKKYSGTYKAHLGHMGDLYNRMVTSKNLGYTPAEINDAMKETLDPILKNISQAQDKLVKNKPPGWKQKLEEYNKKGINYSSLAEGYKSFDVTDPDTLKKYTYGVDYLKTIDPAALYEGKPIKEIAELTDKREINKIQKAFDDLTEAKKIARTEGLEQADISKIKNSELLTGENLKKLQNYSAFEQNREAVLKSQTKIPASEKRRLVQMIGSIGCPTYAIGGRVNFSEGSDCFNKGLKALEEGNLTKPQLNVAARAIAESGEEGMLLKNLLSKAGTGIKFTGRGVGELISIGTGPIGVGLGAALETAFAAPYLLEGDYKQALRQSIFGQVPSWLGVDVGSRDEDIIKGAKEAGVDPDSVKKYVELKKNYIENEEYGQKLNMLDTMYKRDPKNPDYAEQIRRLENKIKPSADYLEKTVYAPKDLDKIEKDYLKAANYFVQKNAAQAPFTRSEEQQKSSLRDIVEESTSAIREPQDVQTILTKEKLLPQEQKQIELPNVVSPDDYINELQQYNAGGRVGFKDGSGPKLSRRGFLGFLAGAAAAPFAGKLIKGEKAALQGTKVAAKILPKAAGMPEWFPSLVARIEKEGKDISVPVKNLEDKIVTKRLEIPVAGEKEPDIVIMHQHPDGSIQIEADVYGGSFDSPFELHYKPPKSDIDLETGKAINDPGEFNVLEQRPRPVGWEGSDLEIDYEYMSPKDAISDIERVEKIATGKRIHPKRVNERTAARKVVEERPYEDVINRYPDPDTGGDWWER